MKPSTLRCPDCSGDFPYLGTGRKPTRCESCQDAYRQAYSRRYYEQNGAAQREAARRRRLADPEGARQRGRVYYATHAEKLRGLKRQWRVENPEQAKAIAERYRDANRESMRARDRRRRRENPDTYKARDLRRRHNLELDELDTLRSAQGFACAICRRHENDIGTLHIDHDHACCPGKNACGRCLRALLCSGCNTGIGMFGENVARLSAAVDYLRAHDVDTEAA